MSALALPDAVAAVTGRIATIQAQFSAASTATRATTTTDTTSAKAFAAELDGAVRTAATASSSADGASTATASSSSTVTGDTVVATAKKYLGVPYVWGGTSPSGLDCSGLVQITFKELGIDLPRVSRDQATAGQPVASMDDARPGDLIAFGTPVDHIAIYVGDGKILEAPEPGKNVRIVDMFREPVAIRRVVPAGDGSEVTAAGLGNATTPDGTAATTELGIPPGFMKLWNIAALDTVPRAVPLTALGILPDTGAVTTATQAASSISSGDGLDAAAPRAADLSDAVAEYAADFASAESAFGLPQGLLAAVAQTESGGRADAVSSAGAQGLMQLMPATAAALGVTDSFDPQQAITGAAKYLSDQLSAFDGNLTNALAAYNAGPGAVRQYGGVPPYAETQNYVKKITDMMTRLT